MNSTVAISLIISNHSPDIFFFNTFTFVIHLDDNHKKVLSQVF